jgi:hypothetical protein
MKPKHKGSSLLSRPDRDETSVDLNLVLRVGAVLAGVWLMLAGALFGLRKIAGLLEIHSSHDSLNDSQNEPIEPPKEKEDLGMKPQGYVPLSASPSAHEGSDLDVAAVLKIAAAFGITLALSIVILALLFHVFEQNHPARTSEAAPLVTSAELPPAPGVTADPAAELRDVQTQENLHLNRYTWVDASHTSAQIPIDRAMAIWVETYSSTPPTLPGPQAVTNQPSTVATPPDSQPVKAMNATNSSLAPQPIPSAGITELQMRQEKATESPHAP